MNRYFTAYPEDADKVVLSIKSGLVDRRTMTMDCSPSGLRKLVDNTLKIPDGKKNIDVFGCARTNPTVPVEESVKALAELKQEGKIGGIQLTEVRAETIRRAASIAKIDMVEAEASLWSPEVFENGVAEACAEHGITLVAHTPLGAGVLTGQIKSLEDLPPNSVYRHHPRFQPDTFPKNLLLVDALDKLAQVKGCTTAQLALSWIKSQIRKPGMPLIVPVAGARSENRILQNAKDIDLNDSDLKEIKSILKSFPTAGPRSLPAAAKLNEY